MNRVHTEATDRPADLTPEEVNIYVRGYSAGCLRYVRKYGTPSVVLDGPAPRAGTPERRALGVRLAELAREHEAERHPTAHRAGMSAVRRHRKARAVWSPPVEARDAA